MEKEKFAAVIILVILSAIILFPIGTATGVSNSKYKINSFGGLGGLHDNNTKYNIKGGEGQIYTTKKSNSNVEVHEGIYPMKQVVTAVTSSSSTTTTTTTTTTLISDSVLVLDFTQEFPEFNSSVKMICIKIFKKICYNFTSGLWGEYP